MLKVFEIRNDERIQTNISKSNQTRSKTYDTQFALPSPIPDKNQPMNTIHCCPNHVATLYHVDLKNSSIQSIIIINRGENISSEIGNVLR